MPPVRHDAPPPGWRSRLHFAWATTWAALFTATLSPGVVIHSAIRPGDRTLKRWLTVWSRLVLRFVPIRLEVRQATPLDPGQPYVFVANHQNALDIVTTSSAIPHPFGFAAKAELRAIPFIGMVLARTACLFVDKSSPRKAAEALLDAARHLRAGHSVLLFPEGGRSWRREMQPFQRGAFVLAVEAGVPLVPVALVGNTGVVDERAFASRPGTVRVVIGAPIPTDGLSRAAAGDLQGRVRAWLEGELEAAG